MSPSSWTATAAGPPGKGSPALPGTVPASPPCAASWNTHPASASVFSRSTLSPQTTGRGPRRRCRVFSGSSAHFFVSNANGCAGTVFVSPWSADATVSRSLFFARFGTQSRQHRPTTRSVSESPSTTHRARLSPRPLLLLPPRASLFPSIACGRSSRQSLTSDCGEVDLLIRSGGEKRLSDYLLWESAYAELHFTDRMWPEFDASDLELAVSEFQHRERRFGTVPAANGRPSSLAEKSA